MLPIWALMLLAIVGCDNQQATQRDLDQRAHDASERGVAAYLSNQQRDAGEEAARNYEAAAPSEKCDWAATAAASFLAAGDTPDAQKWAAIAKRDCPN